MRAFVLLCLLVAGCTAPAADPDADAPTDDKGATGAWSYLCDDARAEVAPGVCASGPADAPAALTEPFLAAHPANDRILAVGVNRHDAAGIPLGPLEGAPAQPIDTEVWFSEDGGATWRASRPPSAIPALAQASEVDPSLAFDVNGTLHYTALVESQLVTHGVVYYSSSPDLGATWTEPVLIADDARGTTDRNWLAILPDGRIVVTWQQYPVGSGIAWSADGGATWARAEDLLPCVGIGPAVQHGVDVLLTCYERGGASERLVLALDPTNGTHVERARLGVPCAWGFLLSDRDTLALACTEGWLASADGGASWGPPVDLRSAASVEDDWPAATLFFAAADGAGGFHALIAGRDAQEVPYASEDPVEERVAHVILDARDLALLHEKRLTAEGAAAKRAPATAMPTLADHFFGIAPTSDGVALAWTRDRGIDVAYALTERASSS